MKKYKHNLRKFLIPYFNLQMFADDLDDDEEIEDGDLPDDENLDNEENDDQDEESDDKADELDGDDEADEADDLSSDDKKTAAIIKYKKQAKQYKSQLDDIEKKNAIEAETKKLVGEGLTEEKATEIATLKHENLQLKRERRDAEINSLEEDYPGASQFSDEIFSYKEGSLKDLTIEEIFLAKFYKKINHDMKTDIEQKVMHSNQKAKNKNKVDGKPPAGNKAAKLSKSDERVYQTLLKSNPGMTRQRFLELADEGEIIEE